MESVAIEGNTTNIPAGEENRRRLSSALFDDDTDGHRLSGATWETNTPVRPLHTACQWDINI